MPIQADFSVDCATANQQRSCRRKDMVFRLQRFPSAGRQGARELRRQQIAQSRQVISREIEQRMRTDSIQPTRHRMAQRADILRPAKGLFDHLASAQADRVTGGRLHLIGHGAALDLGRDMRGNAQRLERGDELGGVVPPVGRQRRLVRRIAGLDAAPGHHQRRLTLSGSGGGRSVDIDDQTVTILGQRMRGVAQVRHAAALASEQGLRVGARDVRLVRALLAAKVHLGVASLIRSGRLVGAVPGHHALVRGPRPQQRAVDTEMLVRHQLGPFGDRHHATEELAHHALLEEPLAIGAERRVIPDRLVQRHADEPPEHHVEIDMLDQRTLRANRKQTLQQRRPQQAFRCNRRAATIGIQRIELRRHRAQNHIGQRFDPAQRMIPVNAVFDIDVAEQGVLFMVDAAHENNQFINADVIISASQPAWMLENLLNQHPVSSRTRLNPEERRAHASS